MTMQKTTEQEAQDLADLAKQMEMKAGLEILEAAFQNVKSQTIFDHSKVEQVKEEAAERNMRFGNQGQKAGEYSLPDLWLGREILNARKKGEELPSRLGAKLLTMTTDGTATGAELLETQTMAALWEDLHLATKVTALLGPPVNMPSQTLKLPYGLGDVTFKKPSGQGQPVTAVDLSTGDKDLVAYPVKAQVDISDELDADSIIALLPQIKQTLVRNGAETLDELVMCADTTTGTTNLNEYGAAIAADSRFLIGFNGLIHQALVDASGVTTVSSLTTLTNASFLTMLALMGKYGGDIDKLVFIMDVWTMFKALGLTNVETVDKFGPAATILRGQLGAIYGVPIVVTGQLPKSDANGRVDGVTAGNNTKGRIICVHRDMWKVGTRQALQIQTEHSAAKGLTSIVAYMRPALECYGVRANMAHTILGYNTTI